MLFIGVMTYAIRGLYWSLLDQCKVPAEIMGLAIGLVSVLGYSPDAVLPLINGYLTQHYPGVYATSVISPAWPRSAAWRRSCSNIDSTSRKPKHEDHRA